MKTKDIKPGVVYGYRDFLTRKLEPVVFLAKPGPDQLYGPRRAVSAFQSYYERKPAYTKPERGYLGSGDIGYPVAFARSEGTDLAELAKVTLYDFLAATKAWDEERGIRYGVVTVVSCVIGPYDEAVAEEQRQSEERQRQHSEYNARREAAQKRVLKLSNALERDHGISSHADEWGEPKALTIPLDDVEKLLGLLGGDRP